MEDKDLEEKLHQEYNVFPLALQDKDAFLFDVQDVGKKAKNTKEFHEMLSKRRDRRVRELNSAWSGIGVSVWLKPNLVLDPIYDPERAEKLDWFTQNKSFDAFIRFLESYIPDDGCVYAANEGSDPDERPTTQESKRKAGKGSKKRHVTEDFEKSQTTTTRKRKRGVDVSEDDAKQPEGMGKQAKVESQPRQQEEASSEDGKPSQAKSQWQDTRDLANRLAKQEQEKWEKLRQLAKLGPKGFARKELPKGWEQAYRAPKA